MQNVSTAVVRLLLAALVFAIPGWAFAVPMGDAQATPAAEMRASFSELVEAEASERPSVLETRSEERANRLMSMLVRIVLHAEERSGLSFDADAVLLLPDEPQLRTAPGLHGLVPGAAAAPALSDWRPTALPAVSSMAYDERDIQTPAAPISTARQAEVVAALPQRPLQPLPWIGFALGVMAIAWIGWRAAA